MLFMNCFGFLLELTSSFQTPEQLHSEKVPENLIPHKVMIIHLFLIWLFQCIKLVTINVAFLTELSFVVLVSSDFSGQPAITEFLAVFIICL